MFTRKRGNAAAIVVATVVAAALARAQSPRPAADSRTLDARLATLRAEADALRGQQQTLLGRLRQLAVTRDTRLVELERTSQTLERVRSDVDAADQRVSAIEQDLAAIAPEIRDRLVRTYKLLPLGYGRLLLSLDEARSIDRTARIVGVVARRDRARLEHYQRLRNERRTEVERLQRERGSLESLQQRLQAEDAALVEARAEQAALLRTIREQRDVNAQLVAELTAARDRLDRSVTGLAPASPGLAGRRGGLVQGGLDWPTQGRIDARFGRETSSRFGTVIVRNGVEIAAEDGAPVRAAEAGRVAFADLFSGFGRVVILDHGSKAYTLYGHLATIDVKKDERVDRGRLLGSVGTAPTGASSLYFEVRIDGRPVDPVQWLKR